MYLGTFWVQQKYKFFFQAEDELGSVLARLGGEIPQVFDVHCAFLQRENDCFVPDIDNMVV